MDEAGGKQTFDVNESGKYDGIVLQPEKSYTLSVELEARKSTTVEISTIGTKSAKIINQVVYLEGKPEKFTSKELLLEVMVKHPKTKKGIPNANISLTDQDGEKYETVTDKKGLVKGIELTPKTRYIVIAYKDMNISEVETFTTGPISEGKVYSKTLFVAFEDSAAIAQAAALTAASTKTAISHTSEKAAKVLPASEYEFYYKYGRKVINENDQTWLNFIDNVVELSKKKAVKVVIKSSASKVPARGGNKKLASIRAKKLETLFRSSLVAKGVDMKRVHFIKSSVVSGPKYKGDAK